MKIDRKKAAARVRDLARQHADTGVWLLQEVLDVEIGRRPAWAPTTDPRHSKALDAIGQESVLEEHMASLREQNERISEVGEPVSFLIAKAAGLGIIEVLGCTALMTSLGYPRPENLFFGVAAAAGIFALVGLSHRRRDPWKYAGIVALGLIAFTISRLRIDDVAEGGEGGQWALAVITLLASIGPAFLAEPVLRKLVALFPDLSRRRHTRREKRALQTRITDAQDLRDRVAEEQIQWDDDRLYVSGVYTLAHNQRCAERGIEPFRPAPQT